VALVSARCVEDLPERFNAAADLIRHNLIAGRASKAAYIDRDRTLSYSALHDHVQRAASGLLAAGIRPEQRVLLCLVDTVEFPIAFLGAIWAGIVPVPLNTLLTADDYRWILDNSRAAAVVLSDEVSDRWAPIMADRKDVAYFGTGTALPISFASLVKAADPLFCPADTHRDEAAFWLYTSGSTGRPKGAMHAHASLRLTANLYGLGHLGIREDDLVLSVAKLFFAYGLGNGLTFPLAAGATALLHDARATPDAVSDLLRRHPVSVLAGVPTFFAGWLASPGLPSRAEAHRLRLATSAGECLPAHLGMAFRDRFGVDVVDGLGSTEMLHVFLAQSPGAVRYGCTGRAVPGYDLRVVAEDGAPVAPGVIGDLQVRGPTAALGYWCNRPKSCATFQGEWTRTGDKYVVDADGWFTYAGRGDDMLKVGGIYVSPVEVEEAIASHQAVLEAAVVGNEDQDGLVKPQAFVVLRDGHHPSSLLEQDLKTHVKRLLAPYKYPRSFVFLDELPKTATGKLQRFRLREARENEGATP